MQLNFSPGAEQWYSHHKFIGGFSEHKYTHFFFMKKCLSLNNEASQISAWRRHLSSICYVIRRRHSSGLVTPSTFYLGSIFTGDVLGAPTSPHPTPSWRGERYTFSFPQQEKQGNTYPKGLHALRLPALITFPPCVLSSQSNELPTQWEVSKVTREVPPLRKVRLGDGVHFGLLSLECGLFGTSSSTFWSL